MIRVKQMERDICYFFHEQSSYSCLMPDLAWGETYVLPPWEFINLDAKHYFLDDESVTFLRNGCLAMIITMAYGCIDGCDSYIHNRLAQCIAGVERLCPDDEDSIKLVEIAMEMLRAIAKGQYGSTKFDDHALWVHKNYVRKYFCARAKNFECEYYNRG